MWSDKVSENDYLGYITHEELIYKLVTDKSMLPTIVGLFGDWGSGKSTIMGLLKKHLDGEAKTACLYFDGWTFEGYDDAKAALLENIVRAFEDEEKFGSNLKDQINKLYKSINWMRAIGFGIKNIAVPMLSAYFTGGVSFLPGMITAGLQRIGDSCSSVPNKENIDQSNRSIAEFKKDFSTLLSKSKIDTLIVLIDDLDRCLPERIIDNLEAIKLFMELPNTAFVVGADPRIVRHAIEHRYKEFIDMNNNSNSKKERIISDYLEKIIQIPYNLPKLSYDEVSSYVVMLFTESVLQNKTEMDYVVNSFADFRGRNKFGAYKIDDVIKALNAEKVGPSKIKEIRDKLSLIIKLTPLIADTLYGNPRQIKRFLNMFMMRKDYASKTGIKGLKDDVLGKLMILEYSEPELFKQLYDWQIYGKGISAELNWLENFARGKKNFQGKSIDHSRHDFAPRWSGIKIVQWLKTDPLLHNCDLRDYFWLSRDSLTNIMSNNSLSGDLDDLLDNLKDEKPDMVIKKIIKDRILTLSAEDKHIVFDRVADWAVSEPDNIWYYNLFNFILDEGVDCSNEYASVLYKITSIPPHVSESLKRYTSYPILKNFIK